MLTILQPRNAPCPCGSGLKWKRCCGATSAQMTRWREARVRHYACVEVQYGLTQYPHSAHGATPIIKGRSPAS